MEQAKLDDATLKLLQDYAAALAARLGLQVTVSADDRGFVAIDAITQSHGEQRSFYGAQPYSNHGDTVHFIDCVLREARNAP